MAVNQADTVAYALNTALVNIAQQTAATTAMGNAGAATAGIAGSTAPGVPWWVAYAVIGSPPNRMESVNQQNGQYLNTNMLPSK